MAIRRSASRRSLHSPLTGVLRDLDRRTRKMPNRRRTPSAPSGEGGGMPGPRGPRGPRGEAGSPPLARRVMTDLDGAAVWRWGERLLAVPVIMATPTALGPVLVTVEAVDEDHAELRAWRLLERGGYEPAPEIRVNVTATLQRYATGR